MDFPKRGEIWLASLEPVIGSEIGKTRPALIISNDRNNQFADTITVLPITSRTIKIYPFETFLSKEESKLPIHSRVVVDGDCITSYGLGTATGWEQAMEFALKLVEILYGEQKATEISQSMLVNW